MGNFSLTVEDFQSIGKAQLEFVPGINFILGQSNSGKTAILRAIDSVLSNPSYAKTFVKNKAEEAEVTFNYNGNSVSWRKPIKGSAKYTINGESYSKTGSSDLFDLVSDTGFVKSDNGEIMNIEGEWNLPFPFDRSPSELFKLFENVFCVSDSTSILKLFKEEEADLVKQNDDIKEKLSKLETRKKALQTLSEEVNLPKLKERLLKFKNDFDNYSQAYSDYEVVCKGEFLNKFCLDDILPPENFSLDKYLELLKDLSFVQEVAEKIKFYKTLPELMTVTDLLPEYNTLYSDIMLIENASQAERFKIDKQIEINENNLVAYFNLLEDLIVIENGFKADKFKIENSCTEDFSLSLSDYEMLREDLKNIVSCYSKCKTLTCKCKELNSAIEKNEAKLRSYKVCPLCGHEL